MTEARSWPGDSSLHRGLLIVHTGDGKGKTTAALGTLLRAWGQGMRPCVIQFIKGEKGRWGEIKAAERLGIEWHTMGKGFTWRSQNLQEDLHRAQEAWSLARSRIASDAYDLILLDEFTYPLKYGWLPVGEVMDWLRAHRPPRLHVIVTGRDAPDALLRDAAAAHGHTRPAPVGHRRPGAYGGTGRPGAAHRLAGAIVDRDPVRRGRGRSGRWRDELL